MPANPAGAGGSRPRRDRPKVQAQRLERLERRKEAGKDINEARLEKLETLKAGEKWTGGTTKGLGGESQEDLEKAIEKFTDPDFLDAVFGGPGQDTAVQNVMALFDAFPELAQEIAQAWLEQKQGKEEPVGKKQFLWGNEAVAQAYHLAVGLPRWGHPGSPVGNMESGWLPTNEEEFAKAVPALGKYVMQNPELFKTLSIGTGGVPQHNQPAGAEPRTAVLESFDLLDDESLWTVNFALQQLMQARQQRINAMTFQGPYFDLGETTGVE